MRPIRKSPAPTPVAQVQQPAPAPRPTPRPPAKADTEKTEIAKYAEKCQLSISSPALYDSLLVDWHERNIVKSHDDFFAQFIEIDPLQPVVGDVPDSVYEARLRRMVSPVNLSYNNIVKSYIVSWTTRNKGTVSRILGLSQVYFPMIEEELSRQGLPLELRMLPVIESALNPSAVSRAGATGMWQFMLATGRSYGLEVTSMVDDRRDPVMATRAAASHLRDLYRMYGDWTIAIAAYNCGAGNVNKAIARAGGEAQTFWDIYPYLPRETRGYLPSFVAANYAYAYHKQHGIEMTNPPLPLCTDTVTVNKLTHFEQISSTLDIPVEALRALNPQYKEDIIPAVERTYALKLPQPEVSRYLAREQEIHAKDSLYLAKYLAQPKAALAPVPSSSIHTVKKGEVLGTIARKHGVTVAQIVKWNKLRNADAIRPGQRLEILK
jgi:membrane-bound lytic murein transglycosylase D